MGQSLAGASPSFAANGGIMRIATLICLLTLVSACGVGGAPQHPEAERPYRSQLTIGTSYTI